MRYQSRAGQSTKAVPQCSPTDRHRRLVSAIILHLANAHYHPLEQSVEPSGLSWPRTYAHGQLFLHASCHELYFSRLVARVGWACARLRETVTMQFSTAVFAFAAVTSASLYGESNDNHTCILVPDYLSCSSKATASNTDSCCVETFGGLLLQTQFWDTYTGHESEGQLLPANTWTIHGLWPDFCNGSFTQYCDLNRQYDPSPSPNTTNGLPNGTVVPRYTGPSIGTFLEPFGKFDLLAYMNKWEGRVRNGIHKTDAANRCFSTFDLPCYGPEYVEHEDVVDFFQTVIRFYKNRPTWGWLSAKGIRPSNTTTYTLSNIQSALTKGYGVTPYVGCSGPRYNETVAGRNSTDNGRTQLSEVWYYLHVYGRPQDGQGVPVNVTGSPSSCAKAEGAVHYYERTALSVRKS
nr:ribonuclease trv [Quercus suber]